MTKEKETYVSPTTETFVVGFEGLICLSNNTNSGTEFFGDAGYEEL